MDLLKEPSHSRLVDGQLETHGFHVMRGQCDYLKPLWHWHRGVELAVVHSGTAQVFSGRWQKTVGPGEATVVSADQGHGSLGRFSRTVVHFMPDMVASNEGRRLLAELIDHGVEMGLHTQLSGEALNRILWASNQLLRLPNQRRHRLTVQALFDLILAELEMCLDQPPNPHLPHPLRSVMNYMQAHPESSETIEVLAERFEVSKGHLSHLFKCHIGCSPHQYWLGIKLEKACALLEGRGSLDQVALDVGFHSVRGFTAAFQRSYAMSPSAYRRIVQSRDDKRS